MFRRPLCSEQNTTQRRQKKRPAVTMKSDLSPPPSPSCYSSSTCTSASIEKGMQSMLTVAESCGIAVPTIDAIAALPSGRPDSLHPTAQRHVPPGLMVANRNKTITGQEHEPCLDTTTAATAFSSLMDTSRATSTTQTSVSFVASKGTSTTVSSANCEAVEVHLSASPPVKSSLSSAAALLKTNITASMIENKTMCVPPPLAADEGKDNHSEAAGTSMNKDNSTTTENKPQEKKQSKRPSETDASLASASVSTFAESATTAPAPDASRHLSTGRWTSQEHQAFLVGLTTYGREWKKVASHIPTRTPAQVRSHAQKYFGKIARDSCSGSSNSTGEAESGAAGATAASASSSSSLSGGATGATFSHLADGAAASAAAAAAALHLSPSVRAHVARILAQPAAVEAEVEDTLRQLHARYQQLQRQLEQTQDGGDGDGSGDGSLSSQNHHYQHQDNDSNPMARPGAVAAAHPSLLQAKHMAQGGALPIGASRKRAPSDMLPPADDQSHSATSLSSVESLQDEELIALSVLRQALPQATMLAVAAAPFVNGAAPPQDAPTDATAEAANCDQEPQRHTDESSVQSHSSAHSASSSSCSSSCKRARHS